MLFCALICTTSLAFSQEKIADTTILKGVEINAYKAGYTTPVSKTEMTKKDIIAQNTGKDLPFILNQTPAVVANSDAGNGVGYTGIRIRGTDASRINVTLNGIPYNDAESQGTFLVNIPDIASSTQNIQIQRGVGTSTNGAGAFGGSIHLNTNELFTKTGLEFNNAFGSYNTRKHTLMLHSGTFGKYFTLDARGSLINSDGYVDRARTDLRSFYASAAYTKEKSSMRLNVFSGKETTYQSWYGINDDQLANDRTYNSAGTAKAGAPYNNETDNYTQTHYQLFYNTQVSTSWKLNLAAFYTKGAGYYEQYKANIKLSSYGLPTYINGADTVKRTNIIRQLWLDNDFYGTNYSAQYKKGNTDVVLGGNYSRYVGDHFGEIIKADAQRAIPVNFRWYDNTANKNDFTAYAKWTEKLSDKFYGFADLQVRAVNYNISGFRDNPGLQVENSYTFFNPKAGITYLNNDVKVYASVAVANKEPNRDDFEAGITTAPKAERLFDIETGIEKRTENGFLAANFYYMDYKDQLILTGQINDVGAYTRTNVPMSYRAGVELQAAKKLSKLFALEGNVSLSTNKVKNFTEFIDDYDAGGQKATSYKESDLAFSPSVVGSGILKVEPAKNLSIILVSKYVSRQYLDNTSDKARSLDNYFTEDVQFVYSFKYKKLKEARAFLHLNNIFNKLYEANGYTFSYIAGGNTITENYYFPQAPFHFMAGFNLSF